MPNTPCVTFPFLNKPRHAKHINETDRQQQPSEANQAIERNSTHPVTPTTKGPKHFGVPSLEMTSPTSLSLARKEGMDGCMCGRGVCCGVRSDFSSGVRVYLICQRMRA